MYSFQLLIDFIFGLLHDVAALFTEHLLFQFIIGLFVFRLIVGTLYKIKKKGGL